MPSKAAAGAVLICQNRVAADQEFLFDKESFEEALKCLQGL